MQLLTFTLFPFLDTDVIKPIQRTPSSQSRRLSFHADGTVLHAAKSMERVASSVFVLGDARPRTRSRSRARSLSNAQISNLPQLSRHITLGRNSTFHNMTETDREILGGIEYRALKVLLKFVFGYFFGLHLLGVICLLPWIHNAPSKYTDWLSESGVGKTWWYVLAYNPCIPCPFDVLHYLFLGLTTS